MPKMNDLFFCTSNMTIFSNDMVKIRDETGDTEFKIGKFFTSRFIKGSRWDKSSGKFRAVTSLQSYAGNIFFPDNFT